MSSKSRILFGALIVAFLFSSSILCLDLSGNSGGTDNLNWKVGDENKSAIASFRDIDVVSYNRYTAPPGVSEFSNLPELQCIELPSTFETITEYAFAGCPKLNQIIIDGPSHLKTIGDYAFAGTGFIHLFLPDTITYIGDYAFAYCDNLLFVDVPYGAYIKPTAFEHCPLSPRINRYYS